jgi:D-alanyl-D-alanine carboxypeptidase
MRTRRVACALTLLLTAAATARADEVDDYIARQMKAQKVPGVALAVIKDGKIVKAAGYGLANRERNIAVTPDTVFKIGSVSKQFIATGIMLLAHEGRLGIDDPVSKYLQGAPDTWKPITIRHLLTHTAGLVRESPAFDPNKNIPDAEIIRAVYGVPLRFAPGARYEYSNTGYWTLAEILRVVTGRPWSEFITQRIFAPVGMRVTAPTNVTPALPNRAAGYTGNDNSTRADDWVALRPSGAFLSTVMDLAKWEAALYTDTVINDATRRQMWEPVRLTDGKTAEYGFGWHVDAVAGRRIWHGGGLPGFSAQYVRFPNAGVTVILLANGDDSDTASMANGLAALFYLPKAG